MKKIVTAINNPILNQELKKEKDLKIIGKDIQYKEAILEILEKNKDIDILIISEKILGQINIDILIKKIKNINEKIKIIFILEKENNELEKTLIKNNIIDIYYNNEINIKELIKIINNPEKNLEEEIIKLKKIIAEKNSNSNEHELIKKENKKYIEFKKDIKKTKIITFSGSTQSGKTTLALIISKFLSRKKKILLVNGDLEKPDLSIILKKEKYKKEHDIYKINKHFHFIKNIEDFKEYKNHFYNYIIIDLSQNNLDKKIIQNSDINFIVMEPNLNHLKEIKYLLNIYNQWKIPKNKLYIIINKKNINSINKKIISNCFLLKNEIYEIKENKIYNCFIHKYFKIKYLLKNKKIKKDVKKILYKINKKFIKTSS